ncbi:MAG: hypothetical protein QME79_00480 [Bacillota bacterium]|nr:hypothetical protein [Bacillota bacterium]
MRRKAGEVRRTAALTAVLCIALSLGLAFPALADPFAEVPLRHWSFDSLALLVPAGLVSEPALSTYRSRPGVMRFEVALLVAQAVRTLEGANPPLSSQLDRLLAAYRVAGSSGRERPLAASETQAVRRLVAEFAPELELLGVVIGPLGAAEPLSLPSSASGPFVDLETLAALAEGGSADSAVSAAALPPPSPAAVAAAVPSPGFVPPLAAVIPGKAGAVTPEVALPPAVLPEAALSRQGSEGPFPGQVAAERQPVYGSVPSPKPVLAVNAAVQPGETRLPVPKLSLSVTPTVQVTGSVAPAEQARPAPGAVQVEARVNVAGVEVGANVKSVQPADPSINPALAQALKVGLVPEAQGYGLSLKLGQVAVTTGFAQVKQGASHTVEQHHSLEVGYAIGEAAVVRAGYQLVDLDAIATTKPRTDASLGVNVNLGRSATVSAGMTLEGLEPGLPAGSAEGQRATAGVELRLPWNAFLTAGYEFYRPAKETSVQTSVRPQSAATLGVGYNFAANATLLVGYRLIDFSPSATADQIRQQNLTAGVSLSF